MTTFKEHRCQHCHTRYTYQTSGWGSDEYQNDKHCPSCYKVILDALSAVPKAFRHEYRAVRDKTAQEVEAVYLANIEHTKQRAKDKNSLPIFRVEFPLFNLDDLSDKYHSGRATIDGIEYKYHYWSKSGIERGVVEINVEVDVATGAVVGPWSLTERWKTRPRFYEPPSQKPLKAPKEVVPNETVVFAKERLERILKAPDMWGSPDAVEHQVLVLLEVYHQANGEQHKADKVRQRFSRFLYENCGPFVSLTAYFKLTDRSSPEFIDALRVFINWETNAKSLHFWRPKSTMSPIIDRDQSLEKAELQSVEAERVFEALGKKEFSTERLPEGVLPIYDKAPDVAPFIAPDVEPVSLRAYTPVGRKSFLVEPLPEGTLPIYDKEPDVTAVVTGESPLWIKKGYRCSTNLKAFIFVCVTCSQITYEDDDTPPTEPCSYCEKRKGTR